MACSLHEQLIGLLSAEVKFSQIPPDPRSSTSVLGSCTSVWRSGTEAGRSVTILHHNVTVGHHSS